MFGDFGNFLIRVIRGKVFEVFGQIFFWENLWWEFEALLPAAGASVTHAHFRIQPAVHEFLETGLSA